MRLRNQSIDTVGAAQFYNMADAEERYAAVVVGAGAAGITAVGNLLEQKIEPILWVDDSFVAGRVNTHYREVMSNTQIWLIVAYAEALSVFRHILSGVPAEDIWAGRTEGKGNCDRLTCLREMDQQEYCELSYAADMLRIFGEELRKFPPVDSRAGWVTGAQLDQTAPESERWAVSVNEDGHSYTVKTQRLILCQGAHPICEPLSVHIPNIQSMDLDDALSHTNLTKLLGDAGPVTVGVIGASHSAIIVLMHLHSIATKHNQDLRVRWFTRHDLRYAVQMDGWILRDTTGLKGIPAQFAKNNLEPDMLAKSDVGKYLTRIDYDKDEQEGTFDDRMPGCSYYIQAIGYTNNAHPELKTITGKDVVPHFNNSKGCFHYDEGCKGGEQTKIPGLYGLGIAWPERVTDPRGNEELSVGFLKFMKFIKREIVDWD